MNINLKIMKSQLKIIIHLVHVINYNYKLIILFIFIYSKELLFML